MPDSVCGGCGLSLARVGGLGHPYMFGSAECWAQYGELLAAQYQDPRRMAFHQLVVDAYAVAHPGAAGKSPDARAVQSVGIHLMTLCLFLERDVAPEMGTRLHGEMVARPVFTYLPRPDVTNALTHMHVPRTGEPSLARAAAYEWADCVWADWADHHRTVRGWLVEAGLA